METLNSVDIKFENDLTIKADRTYQTTITGDVSKDSIAECAKLCEIDEIFTDEQIINYVKNNFTPDKVFDKADLNEWAKENFSV